jgi:hypothetical protein
MEPMIRKALLVAGLVGLIVTASGSAQITNQVAFSTSFPFSAGNATLPAGKYTIRPVEGEENLMEVSGVNTPTSVLLEVETATNPEPPKKSEVVFKKYGNNYVLSEIWEAGTPTGAAAVKSRVEQRHEKKNGPPTKQSVPTSKA